jgi:hypothetical protein
LAAWFKRRRKPLLILSATLLLLALGAVAANGYRVAANKPSKSELSEEYNNGYAVGREDGEEAGEEVGEEAGEEVGEAFGEEVGEENLRRLRGKSYWRGWEEGWDDAVEVVDEEAGRINAEGQYEDLELEPDPYEYTPPPDVPEYSPDYEPSYPPTTEDFGQGHGYVVECTDGTLSDSGGIQGACSHHGGVR